MIKISFEKEKVIKSLNELKKEYNKGNIPESHYISQKRQLTERLENLEAINKVRKLQGKEDIEVPVDEKVDKNEDEKEELFKKFITSPGLKEKNIKSKGISLNTKIATAVLAVAFFIGVGFGVYTLNMPPEASSTHLFTNDSAFPPFVLNNTTNATNTTKPLNTTKIVMNVTKPLNTTTVIIKPKTTPKSNSTTHTTTPNPNDSNVSGKTVRHYYYPYDPNLDNYY